MPEKLGCDPEINNQIYASILRLQAASLEWSDNPIGRGFDDHIVETLVESLNIHADAYLHKVDRKDLISQYVDYIRGVGAALIWNAEHRSFLSDPFSDDCLRKMAENSGAFLSRKPFLTPEQREEEIRNAIEPFRIGFREEALKWHQSYNQMLVRILTRFEARYQHWKAEAIERVQRRGFELETATAPTPEAPSNAVSRSPTQGTTLDPSKLGSRSERIPALREIEDALDEGSRKQAVQMRCTLDNCTITALWMDAFKSRKGTDNTKRTAFNRWQASRPDTPAWADGLILARLLRLIGVFACVFAYTPILIHLHVGVPC